MLQAVLEPNEVAIDADDWLDESADLLAFDQRIHRAEDRVRGARSIHLMVSGEDSAVARAQHELALRYQRLWPRRNEASHSALFDQILGRHRALHPLEKPLVRADYDHAIDVWQWLLRLAPNAGLALQIAALFHDIERLSSEADARIEHTADNYLAFKQAHARGGAAIMLHSLAGLAVPEDVRSRACSLIERHEQPEHDPELATLNDADCLSFFALNSPGFIRYFGAEHTAKKVAYTLARMSPSARPWLDTVRLEPTIAQLVRSTQREQAGKVA